MGAKRLSVFGDPPIGCLPSQRTLAGGVHRECNEYYNQAAQMYNTKLIASLKALNHSLNDPKARIIYTDIYNPLLDLIQNYKKYGNTTHIRYFFCPQIIDTVKMTWSVNYLKMIIDLVLS